MSGRDPRYKSGWWVGPVLLVALVTWAYIIAVVVTEWVR